MPDRLEDLSMGHEQIQFRKQHLGRYLTALVTKPYDGRKVLYLDMVGKIHTPKAGSAELDVPLVQMNALLGFVSDALVATILGFNLPRDQEVATLRAFNKLFSYGCRMIYVHDTTRPPRSRRPSRKVDRRSHPLGWGLVSIGGQLGRRGAINELMFFSARVVDTWNRIE